MAFDIFTGQDSGASAPTAAAPTAPSTTTSSGGSFNIFSGQVEQPPAAPAPVTSGPVTPPAAPTTPLFSKSNSAGIAPPPEQKAPTPTSVNTQTFGQKYNQVMDNISLNIGAGEASLASGAVKGFSDLVNLLGDHFKNNQISQGLQKMNPSYNPDANRQAFNNASTAIQTKIDTAVGKSGANPTVTKAAHGVGEFVGKLPAFEVGGEATEASGASAFLGDLASKIPGVGKYLTPVVQNFVKNLGSFSAASQPFAQQNNPNAASPHWTQLKQDLGMSASFAVPGSIPNPILAVPAMGTIAYGMAKLNGQSNADAFASGIVMAAMHTAGMLGKDTPTTVKEAKDVLYTKAIDTINEHARDKITPNSTPEEVDRAFKQAAMKLHPDIPETGDTAKFQAINWARDFIKTGYKGSYLGSTKSEDTSTKVDETKQLSSGNIPDVVKQEVTDHLETHGENATITAMEENLGVPIQEATKIVQSVKQENMLKNPDAFTEKLFPKQTQAAEKPTVENTPTKQEQVTTPSSVDKTVEKGDNALAQTVYEKTKANGGVTISTDNKQPAKGYAYAPEKSTERSYPTHEFSEAHVMKFMQDNHAALSQPGNHIGTWEENGKTYLDISRVGAPSAETIKGAQDAHQLGVYDLEHGKTIPTGKLAEDGSGVYTPLDEASHIHDQHQKEIARANSESGDKGAQEISHSKEESGSGGGEKGDSLTVTPEAKTAEESYTMAGSAGFIDPGAIAQSVKDAIKNVKETIDHNEKIGEINGKISDAIYREEGANTALKYRLATLVDQVRESSTPEEREHVYHRMEDPTVKLTAREEKEILPIVQTLDKALEKTRAEYRSLGGVITQDILTEQTPRQAMVPDSPITRALKDLVKKKDHTVIKNGGFLSKSLGGGAKHRVFHIAVDDAGKRTVISIKAKRVTAFENKKLTDLGTLKTKTRDQLMKDDVQPLQEKIKRTQKLIDTLESVKVKEPVSGKKLDTLETRIEALKQYSEQRAKENEGKAAIHESMASDIAKENATIDKLETRLKILQKYGNVPKIANDLAKLETDINSAYERETNLSLSDIYENLSEFVDRKEAIDQKLQQDLEKTKMAWKILSKIPKGEDIILTKERIANANAKMLKLTNELSNIEGKYNPDQLDERIFVDKTGKTYKIGQATTKEIEQHTNIKYYKDPVANYAIALERTLRSTRALKFINRIKESPEFSDVVVKEGEATVPEGFKTTKLQQFRGYYMEPQVAEAFDDLATRQQGGTHIPIYDEVNNILISAIVINPVMHFPNVLVGYGAAQAGTGIIPLGTATSRENFTKAIQGVRNFDAGYLDWLEHGAPFAALKGTNAQFTKAILDTVAKDVQNPKSDFQKEWEPMAKVLGYANPIEWGKALEKMNSNITWTGNDIMLYHALLDYQSTHDSTKEEAIAEVSKRMADYRLPSRVMGSRNLSLLMQNNAILLFMRYHYSGTIRPWIENIKDTGDFRDEANGGSTNRQRMAALRTLAFFAGLYVLYHGIDKLLQKMTGNPNTYMSMAGPMKLVQNIEKLEQGQTPSAFAQSIFGIAPAAKLVIGAWTNVDIGQFNSPVFGPGGEGVAALVAGQASIYTQVQNAVQGKDSWTNFALSLGGVFSPKSTIQTTNLNGMLNLEKPQIVSKIKAMIAAGNQAGALALAKDFNDRLKTTIKEADISQGNSGDDARVQYFLNDFANGLGQKGYGVRMPTAQQMANYEAKQGKSAGQKTTPGPGNKNSQAGAASDITNHTNPGNVKGDVHGVTMYWRMSNELAVKAQMEGGTIKPGTQLDHIVPLEGGGSNVIDNLQILTTAQDNINQPVEDFIGQQVRQGNMTLDQATEISVRFKAGLGQPLTSTLMNDYHSKYGGKPMTLEQIYDYKNNL
jgi:hypothetical protein